MNGKSCCGPSREPSLGAQHPVFESTARSALEYAAVAVPGGRGLVGTSRPVIPDDGEGPLRKTKLKPFRISPTAVSNAEFEAFVKATGYVTEAERIGWSFVFWAQVPADTQTTEWAQGADWWRRVDGANWRDINGPGTAAKAWHPDHPVVHMSWNDAQAYCTWAGGRLPSEVEWEHAARGGLGDVPFPWGTEEPDDHDHTPCNIWQGRFPETNTGKDGYLTTAPVQSFQPNGYGLYNMVGNVWEWTADTYRIKSLKRAVKERLAQMKGYRLAKGGSFLCHASYCYRYRIAARSGTSPDSATTHYGFRVVWS